MKILSVLILLVLFFAPSAGASPFLVCDPYPVTADQPSEFRITYGTTTIVSPAETLPDGSKRLHWDLAPLVAGTYNLSVIAARVDSVWGDMVSTAVPFTFTKPALGALPSPANIRFLK